MELHPAGASHQGSVLGPVLFSSIADHLDEGIEDILRFFGAIWRDLRMVCTRKTKTLVSTCVILSGMTNIVCLLYVGWVTNYIASVYVKVQEPISEKKLEEDKGDTLRIIERLDHLENVIKQHIQVKTIFVVLMKVFNQSLNNESGAEAGSYDFHALHKVDKLEDFAFFSGKVHFC
ncbi:hypothetical protein BTVI_83819 [Pitangus sulphuratus]|nr:hypothetical protein BTVI_83819 [Pitangus sulphuratus]